MEHDMNTTEPELADLDEIPTAVIHGVIPMSEMVGFFDRSFTELAGVLARQGVTPVGAGFARYAGPPDETVDLEVGFPVDGDVSAEGEVRAGSLPAGRVARLVHQGAFDGLGESWARLGEWIGAQGMTPGADMWEVYVTEPSPDMDPAELRTELFWTLQ
jgi:effector-binding domain-containing protein